MIITNFYFNSPTYNFDKSFSSKSVTDKTSFRPNSQLVRENLAGKTKLNHLYDYPDGNFNDKPDFSPLHGFPDRTEINTAIDFIKSNIESKKELDKEKFEKDTGKKLDKEFKEIVIKSLSGNQADSTSVASDS